MCLSLRWFVFCVMAVGVCAIAMPAQAACGTDEVVAFPDFNLETAIRDNLSNYTDPLLDSMLCEITELDADNYGIVDITGIEHCVGLTSLDLQNNAIVDITPIAGLTGLTSLNLYTNRITDISPVANLVSLDYLQFYNNQVSDISALSSLTNLTVLTIGYNQIENLAPIAGLTALEYLYINHNRIYNLDPINNLTSLIYLEASDNYLYAVYNISYLPSLISFSVANNPGITDLHYFDASVNFNANSQLNFLGCPLDGHSMCVTVPTLQALGANVFTTGTCTASGTNDFCANAVPLPRNGSVAGRIFGATKDGANSCSQFDINDVWFSYTSNIDGDVLISSYPTDFDSNLAVFDACGGTQITCNEDTLADDAEISFAATADTTYYVRLGATLGVGADYRVYASQSTNCGTGSTEVNIPDPALEAAIRLATGKAVDPLYDSDLCEVSTLNLNNQGVTNLEGLQYLQGLEFLDISYNAITDLAPLTGLANLRILNAIQIDATNFSPISSLTNLREINLTYGLLGDLSMLSGLTELTSVIANSCQIIDLSGLSNATNLKTLMLYGNSFSSLAPLSNLTSLELLLLSSNEFLTSLDGIENLSQLERLLADHCPLTDTSAIASLTSLTHLYLQASQISDLSMLSTLVNLTDLHAPSNDISDIGPLANLVSLVNLDIYFNQISDLTALSSLANLSRVELDNNLITDISPLVANVNFAAFDSIYLYGNPLSAEALCEDVPALRMMGPNVYVSRECASGTNDDTCETAYEINNLGDTYFGDTTTASGSATSTCGTNDMNDVWFFVNAPYDGPLRVSACGSATPVTLSIFDSCGGTELACSTANVACGDNAPSVDFNAQADTRYYIRVAGQNGAQGFFQIVPAVPPCGSSAVVTVPDDDLEAALRLALGKPTGDLLESDLCQLLFLNASSREITDLTGLEACTNLTSIQFRSNQISSLAPLAGLTQLNTIMGGNNLVTSLEPLTDLVNLDYLDLEYNLVEDLTPLITNTGIGMDDAIYLFNDPLSALALCDQIPALEGRGAFIEYTGQCFAAADNNECGVNPVLLVEGQSSGGSNLGATGTDETSCGASDTADVWFVYTASAVGTATFDTCGSALDTTLAVYDSCGGALLACNESSAFCPDGRSQVSLPVTPGNVYQVRLAGVGNATGDYGISVSLDVDTGEGEGVADGVLEGIEEGVVDGIVEGQPDGGADGEGNAEGEGKGEDPREFQSGDQDQDNQINLTELLRSVQLYAANGLHCDGSTEDGYAVGPGLQNCPSYSVDYNPQDWRVSLSELLRLIQFFTLGGYHYCPLDGTEDDYCIGM